MPKEQHHEIAGPLTVAIGLAVTAGFVDAFVYRNVVPVFVANMSGNLIRIGMATGDLDDHTVAASAIALAAFGAAAAAGAIAIDRRLTRGMSPDPTRLLLAEVVLLTALAVVAVATEVEYSGDLSGPRTVIVVLGSAAMGVQAIALRRVGEIAVSTTYGTGAVVRLGEKVALGLRRAPRHHGVPRRASIFVLSAILVAYVAGAALASAAPARRRSLGLAPVVTLALAQGAHRVSGRWQGATRRERALTRERVER